MACPNLRSLGPISGAGGAPPLLVWVMNESLDLFLLLRPELAFSA